MFTLLGTIASNYYEISFPVALFLVCQDIALIGYMVKPGKRGE